MIPTPAFGVKDRERAGLRRSQSTKMTRCPTCATSPANAAATVDLPSPGRDDVNPMTFAEPFAPRRSEANFNARMDSANRENGASFTSDNVPAAGPLILWFFGSVISCFRDEDFRRR